jgi:hypothetical protein
MISRNLGRFFIPLCTFEEDMSFVRDIMSQVIVLDARHRFDLQAIEYLAISDSFRPIPITEAAPRYAIVTANGKPCFLEGVEL